MIKFLRKVSLFPAILFGGVLLLSPLKSISQTHSNGIDAEDLWRNNYTPWLRNLKTTVGATNANFALFYKYDKDTFYHDKYVFFQKAIAGLMNGSSASYYFSRLQSKYVALYTQFATLLAQNPIAINQVVAGQNQVPGSVNRVMSVCNTACFNMDCSLGTLDGWNAYYAHNQSSTSSLSVTALIGGPAGPVTQAAQDPGTGNDYQVSLMSGTGVDGLGGFPVVPPGGTHSIRIGDSTGVLQGVAEATYSYVVPSSNPNLVIQYAPVLQSGGHQGYGQPWFNMEVTDSVGNNLSTCAQYFVLAGSNSFDSNATYDPPYTVYYKPWVTVMVPLHGYEGHCVTIVFEAADCYAGGHFGYAYVNCFSMDCNGPDLIIASSPNFCGQGHITLTGPAGGASYHWLGPCISGSTSQQSCSITCAGTYSLVYVSAAGPTCADTLHITIGNAPGPPPVPKFTSDTVCSGSPTQFTNLSNPLSGAGVKFYWDFFNNGGYEDSTQTNPQWTYGLGGEYHVRLHEVNNGCGADTTLAVIVDSSSTPQISGSVDACVGQSAFFDNITGGNYTWNFGDPNCPANQDTSTMQFVTHTYTVAGTYTVTLKKGGHCPDSASQVVTVSSSPVENITMHAVCGDSTVTFQADDSTNIGSYDWSFYGSTGWWLGGSFSTSSASTSFTFPSSNSSYEVILYAYPSTGGFCPGTVTLDFTLGHLNNTGFTATGACAGQNTIFTDTSSSPASKWLWNFGDPGSGTADTSTLASPAHKYNNIGSYTIKLIVTSASGCVDSVTNSIMINPSAVANFTGDSVCASDSSHFVNMSTTYGGGAISGYVWNFDDPASGASNTSTLLNPAHKFSAVGSYLVSLTALTATGCDSTIIKTIVISSGPTAGFTSTKACLGVTTQFTDTSAGSPVTWNWSFGDGGTSVLQSPSHTYAAVGNYNVKLLVSGGGGCSDSIIKTISVNPNPVAGFSADTLFGCAPLCVKYTDLSTIVGGTNVKWRWNLGTPADTSLLQNPSICYNGSGFYSISLTVTSDSGCSANSTANNMIDVYGKPKASYTVNSQIVTLLEPNVTYTSTSSTTPGDSIVSYLWRFADTLAFTPNLMRTYTDTGTFCATLIVANEKGCVDSTMQCIEVQPDFSFYIPSAFSPNGNGLNDIFKPVGMYIKEFNMYIFDRWGTMVFSTSDPNQGWNGKINGVMTGEETYVYNIQITDTQGKKHTYIGSVSALQ